MTLHPIPAQWNGDSFVPARGFQKAADRQFVVGQVYTIQAEESRSGPAHRRYFAAVNEAWKNLPEALAITYPTAEHLRKRALIMTGYRTSQQTVCASNAEALRLAAFVGSLDPYALPVVERSICTVLRAESQSVKAMGKDRFNESVKAVEDWCAGLINTSGDALRKHSFREAA